MKVAECGNPVRASTGLTFCTVVRRGRLGRARALAQSICKHHAGAPFFVLVLDPVAGTFLSGEPFALVRPEELVWDDLPRRRFLDSAEELVRASKPRLLAYLFAKYGARKLIYLDPELELERELRPLERCLSRHAVVLAPHLGAGSDCPAFLALARGSEATAYLAWWQRQADKAPDLTESRRHAEKIWIEPVPGLVLQKSSDGPDRPYGWAAFDNGVVITDLVRRCYDKLGTAAASFGNPFATSGNSFYRWLTTCAGRGLSPILREWYDKRPDLRALFPEVTGRDREAFLTWACAEAKLPDLDPTLLESVCPSAAKGRLQQTAQGGPVTRPFGINLLGYLQSEKGVGEHARATIRSLVAAGIPHALNNWVDPGSSNVDTNFGNFTTENPYPVNLIVLNADGAPVLAKEMPEYLKGRYNIGYWNWELEWFPPQWCGAFQYFDEIWGPSTFTQASIARVSPIPVYSVPESIVIPPARADSAITRQRFGLPRDAFLFMFAFDFHSYLARKNPLAVIEAFRQAFPKRRDVLLVLKTSRSKATPIEFSEVLTACRGQPNIRILREILTREEMYDLLRLCDCYVGLHRSEGFGLPLAEAMALGKPVIATGYSANLDFMNEFNSFPVRYRMVPIEEDHGPYRKGAEWADPDIDHAAEQMRRVVDSPDATACIAARGRADIARLLNPMACGQQILARLDAIRRQHPLERRAG